MIRKLLLLSAVLLAAAWRPAAALPLVDLSVVDRDDGQALPEYRARGETWIAGTPGHRYAVRLSNRSDERVLVVLSVDGVNAVSGQDADPGQAGYVLGPWETAEIAGWRKSLDDIAQFVFTDLPDSYAARTGRPDNVGVIGIAVFRERRVYPPRYPRYAPPVADAAHERSAAKAAAPAAESSATDSAYGGVARQSIGTGHGTREWAPVGSTSFVRASSRPAQLTQVRYDDQASLVALGVVPPPYPRYPYPRVPRAFPQGFVPDPPRW